MYVRCTTPTQTDGWTLGNCQKSLVSVREALCLVTAGCTLRNRLKQGYLFSDVPVVGWGLLEGRGQLPHDVVGMNLLGNQAGRNLLHIPIHLMRFIYGCFDFTCVLQAVES